MTVQEFAKLFIENYKRALLTKSKEIPVLQDERVRREITDLALQVLNEMAGTLDLSNLKAQELQSLIEPVIWKVAKALEENLTKKVHNDLVELAGLVGEGLGRTRRIIIDEISEKINSAKDEINNKISDEMYQSQRIW
jgi:hypothetical protein